VTAPARQYSSTKSSPPMREAFIGGEHLLHRWGTPFSSVDKKSPP